MAEAFLTPIIESLVQLLTNEVRSLTGIRKEVESLKRELEIIQSLLIDADARSSKGELSVAVKTWVKQLREEADHLEDVIDEYRHHVIQNNTDHKQGFIGCLYNIVYRIKGLMSRYPITSQVRDINKSIREIKDRGQAYGLGLSLQLQGSSSNTTHIEEHDPRLDSLFIEESEFVDVHSMRKKLIGILTDGTSERMLISLVGEGGIGKTTLAKKIYEDERVKSHFDCHAWITVSQSYKIKGVLMRMARQISLKIKRSEGETDTIDELISSVKQHLQTKRYVIVFDDIWHTEFWQWVRHALPSNKKASRVIITTRNSVIADNCKEQPYDITQELKNWSQELAWKLFCKKAFQFEYERLCPEELKQLSYRIVSKCQGLPIVIAAIAGLLSTKKKVEFEWQRVFDDLDSEFEKNPQLSSISRILSLSYHDLPYHLKPCFLYFGIFPEDHLISSFTLKQLWINEGLIEARRDKTLSQVAEEYLNELNYRNLVSFEFEWTKKKYQVHDLMRDIILSRAKESCFFEIMDEGKIRFAGRSRRLSIIHNSTKNIVETIEHTGVRSMFFFNLNDLSTSCLVTLFKSFNLLKILNLSHAPLVDLPREVGNLFHLKYLSLEGTMMKTLPNSIGKLYNLQTLDLFGSSVHTLPKSMGKLQNLQTLVLIRTPVQELPIEINKLQSLKYLAAFSVNNNYRNRSCSNRVLGLKIYGEIGSLQNLETLRVVELHPGSVGVIKDLGKLMNLRELGFSKVTRETGRAICAAAEKMKRLEYLSLAAISDDEILDLEFNISSSYMRRLSLYSRLEKFPSWIPRLYNLQWLELHYLRMKDDPLQYLKAMPNLMYLVLDTAYDGEQLHFEEGSFQNLKELRLYYMAGLRVMKIDHAETTSSSTSLPMPLLEKLTIENCPQLRELPAEIQQLRNLKVVWLAEMSREFVVRLQPEGGSDYFKIKHIPLVKFSYRKEEGTGYNEYKPGQLELLERIQ